MDKQMVFNLFSNMIEKMSNEEIDMALKQAKTLLGPEDYKKFEAMVAEKKKP